MQLLTSFNFYGIGDANEMDKGEEKEVNRRSKNTRRYVHIGIKIMLHVKI